MQIKTTMTYHLTTVKETTNNKDVQKGKTLTPLVGIHIFAATIEKRMEILKQTNKQTIRTTT